MDCPAVNIVSKTYPLACNVVKGASAKVDWGEVDLLQYVSFGKYLDAENCCVLPVRGRDFYIKDKGPIRLTEKGAYSQKDVS